jgi:signal transduction histidine kinase
VRRKRVASLRVRVGVGAAAVLALGVLLAAFSAYALLQGSLRSDVDRSLRDRAGLVLEELAKDPIEESLEPTGIETGEVQVIALDGRILAATPGMTDRPRLSVVGSVPLGSERIGTVVDPVIDPQPGEQYRVLTRTVRTRLGIVRIYVGSSLDTQRRIEERFRTGMAFTGPLLVALTALLAVRAVGRALAPVETMRGEVDRIEATNLSVRLAGDGSNDELSRLRVTLNRLLDRVDESARSQRRFAAAASHELRSPATAMRTELEVGLAYPDRANWPQIAADCLDELARSEAIISDLRILTANRTAPLRFSTVDLAELVTTEVARRPRVRDINYRLDTESARLVGDADALLQVIRNLCTNAERHALHEITVRVHSTNGEAVLHVGNDGAEIAASEREHIFEPFTRLDEARSKESGGSGLGLAIARALCVAHGGTLRAVDAQVGALFEMVLPASAPPDR